jgi:hypothetical protein
MTTPIASTPDPDELGHLRLLLGREPTVVDLGRYRRRRARLLLRQHQAIRLGTGRLITRW